MALSAAERMRRTRARRRAMREAGQAIQQAQQLSMAELVELHPAAPSAAARGRRGDYLAVLERRFPAPLGILAAIYTTPVEELVRALGCTRLEALREKRAAAEASLPYWHQKQATAIDLSGAPLVPMQVVLSETSARAAGLLDDHEQDQRVIEGRAE